MNNSVADQADGLRRLMANSPARRLAFVGGGPAVGVSSVTMNLAAALGRRGHPVCLLSERDGTSSLRPRQGQLVLLDARLDAHGRLSSLAASADDVVVVLRPQAESITAAYACIKRLHQAHGLSNLRVLLNHAADAGEAERIFLNLTLVARRYLGLRLTFAGCIRADVQLAQAHWLNMSVVDAFPGSQAAVDVERLTSNLLRWPSHGPDNLRSTRPAEQARLSVSRERSLATAAV